MELWAPGICFLDQKLCRFLSPIVLHCFTNWPIREWSMSLVSLFLVSPNGIWSGENLRKRSSLLRASLPLIRRWRKKSLASEPGFHVRICAYFLLVPPWAAIPDAKNIDFRLKRLRTDLMCELICVCSHFRFLNVYSDGGLRPLSREASLTKLDVYVDPHILCSSSIVYCNANTDDRWDHLVYANTGHFFTLRCSSYPPRSSIGPCSQ